MKFCRVQRSDLYFIGFRDSWSYIFLQNNAVIFCLIALAIGCIFYKKESYQTLNGVMILATLGMFIALMIPRTTLSYHTLPILGLSFLLLTSYFSQIFLINKLRSFACFSAIIITFFWLPLTNYAIKLKWEMTNHRGLQHQLTRLISALPEEKSLVCFSPFTTCGCFPLIYNTHSHYGSSFPFYWWFKSVQYYDAHYKVLPPQNPQ